MHVRHPQSDDEVRAIVRVNRRAWLEAYDDILPESVLSDVAEPPTDDELAARLDSMWADRDRLLVAVEADPPTDDATDREGANGRDDATDREGANAHDDSVRGYANVRWDPEETKAFVGPDEAGLKELYVDPDHWSRGVGTALLEAAVDLVDDATALVLETLAGNDRGRRFYEARGFERRGTGAFEVAGEPHETVVYAMAL